MQIRTHGDEGGCSMAEALPGLSNQDMAVGAEGGGGHTADDDRAVEEGRQKSMSVRSPSSKFHQSRDIFRHPQLHISPYHGTARASSGLLE